MISKISFQEYQKIQALNISSLVHIKKSPSNFIWKKENPEDSKSMSLGRSIHTMILEPETFDDVYAVKPCKENFKFITHDDLKPLLEKYSVKKGKTKGDTINSLCPFLSVDERKNIYDLALDGFELESQGKEILEYDDFVKAKTICDKVLSHKMIQNMLKKGNTELSIECNVLGVDCKSRIDLLCPGLGIVDIKTCQTLKDFPKDFQKFMYAEKTSFYQKCVEIHSGEKLPVFIVAVETTEKEECDFGFFEVSQEYLDWGFSEVEKMFDTYKTCIKKNEWPSKTKEVQLLRKPEWLK